MYDLHLHSIYSNDSYPWATMDNMCEAGISKGLKGMCFTDHIDIDYPNNEDMFNIDEYISSINETCHKFKNRINVYKGIELGLQPHLSKKNKDISSNYDFDFILGSIHVVGRKELYGSDFVKDDTDHNGIINYFRDLKECLSNFEDFDSLGHIDGVRRYLNNGEKYFSFEMYIDQLSEVLRMLISMGKGLELNTSGTRYGLSEYHPLTDILHLYKKLGGEIITLGSDAHKPEDIAYEFQDALSLLSKVGFQYYCIFIKRKPVYINIGQ